MQDTQRTDLTSITQNTNNIIDRPDRAPEPAAYAPKISGSGLHALELQDVKRIKAQNREYDEARDIMQYITDEIVLQITNFVANDLTEKSVSAQQLFHIMMIEFTHTKSNKFVISLSQYMKYRGLKDSKTAREQFRRDLNLWYRVNVTFEERKIKDHPLPFRGMRILQAYPDPVNGKAVIVLTEMFYNYLLLIQSQIQMFPLALLRLSAQWDKYAYIMGTYLSYLERVQAGDPNQYHLKIETILQRCYFPTIEETNRHPERIIEAFYKAANTLIDIGYLSRYELTDTNGDTANAGRLASNDYDYFTSLYFDYTTTTPDQGHLIEARDTQRERAKAAKQKQLQQRTKSE